MTKQTDKPIEKMTVKELRQIAREIPDATGVHAMKKDELLALITKTRGEKTTAPAAAKKPKKTKAPKKSMTPKEIKALLTELRGERESARQAKDKTRVNVLRRRINRLKKQARKTAAAAA